MYNVGCKLIVLLFTQMTLIDVGGFVFILGIVIWSVRQMYSVNIVRLQT
jgi:hypothetical protein